MNLPPIRLIILPALMLAKSAFAAGAGLSLTMDVDLNDRAALQRGARTFVNYCLGCHSAAYMRYNRIGKDLGISESILKTNFMFGDEKPGDTMKTAMSKEAGEKFFGVSPPDLSVIARARGSDWLYSYFKTFYTDPSRPFGVNNLTFKDTAMPHVLWELQGMQRPVYQTETDAAGNQKKTITGFEITAAGRQTEAGYDRTVKDLVNFLVYLGEPAKLKRTKIGIWVLLYLFIFLAVAYLLKKEYWRDIH